MGDNSIYQFPVALEWDLGPMKLKELKNKLLLYIQSKNKSNGGECVIKDPDCTQGYVLIHFRQETDTNMQGHSGCAPIPGGSSTRASARALEICASPAGPLLEIAGPVQQNFWGTLGTADPGPTPDTAHSTPQLKDHTDISTKKVQKRVLGKRTHELTLCSGKRLKLDVNLPESLSPAAAQLMSRVHDPERKNVSDSCRQETLSLLVENVSAKCEGRDFYIEMIPESSAAVVTFTRNIDLLNFTDKFCSSPRVHQMKLTAEPMKVTKSIRAENLPPNTLETDLMIYFECPRNGGGRVQNVVVIPEEEAALLAFFDKRVVQMVMEKMHVFGKRPISVYLYYESPGITLYGKKGPCITLPKPLEIPVSPYVLEFILGDPQIRENIEKKMAFKNCEITWPDLKSSNLTIKLSIPSSISSHVRTMAKIVRTWKDQVLTEFCNFISLYKAAEYNVSPSVWEAIKGGIFLAGLLSDVNKIGQTLSNLVSNVTKEAERQMQSLEEVEPVLLSLYKLLLAEGLEKTVMGRYPQLEMSYDKLTKSLKIRGLRDEIDAVKCSIRNMKGAFMQKAVIFPSVVLNFLRQADMDELSCLLLIDHGIRAMFQMENAMPTLIGCSMKALTDAEERMRHELQWKEVHTDHQINQSLEWANLKVHLNKTLNADKCTLMVNDLASVGKSSVILSGFSSSVQSAYLQIHEFVEKNSPLQKDIPIKSDVAIKYLKETEAQLKNVKNITVQIELQQHMISLQGPRLDVQEAETLIQTVLSSLHIRKLIIKKPGVKKLCKKYADTYSPTAMSKFSCVIHVQEGQEDGLSSGAVKHISQAHLRDEVTTVQLITKEHLTISVIQRGIQNAMSDAIVNSVGQTLDLSRGKSCRALFSQAGPKLQEHLKHVSQGALVVPGSVFVTDGCNLNCQKIIHIVTPSWDHGAGSSEMLLRKIFKSCLELVEQQQLTSISFPAIGTGNLAFPKDLVATVMFDEVLQFSSNNKLQNLKEVAFILHPSDTDTIKVIVTVL
ncbi:hypothetical protein XELAEV_18044337mg [Xenopus laevis]|uniref:Macro domain-containing protein n=1 Tax=Xenopus laevis TaxID=8355 RepID=A0A974BYB0_XENLA|nr:hypothetical protein XELAEV_18044337mg [Xenopus laevis]